MAFEFGFDVVRVEIEEIEGSPEGREFQIEAMAGDVTAHIRSDVQGLADLLREIRREEYELDHRRGAAWEPQLPQTKGFFFHPRVFLSHIEAIGPHIDEDGDVDWWEFIIDDDDDGSQVILRMSEPTTQQMVLRIEELVGDMAGS